MPRRLGTVRLDSGRSAGRKRSAHLHRPLHVERRNAHRQRILHTRFVGHKRFSIEGAETLIPALHELLSHAGDLGIRRAVMGMAHRGRLNVLTHILSKPLTKIFSEFEGFIDPALALGSGDVKYHLGARGTFRSPTGVEIALELASNPSHLEAVDPVVEGMARARQNQTDGSQDRQQSSRRHRPSPPRRRASSRTPICRNSMRVRKVRAISRTRARKSTRFSAVK